MGKRCGNGLPDYCHVHHWREIRRPMRKHGRPAHPTAANAMRITNYDEGKMTISELAKVVLAYAANRAEPFTSYQAYNDIEESQDKNLVSDTLGFLYRKGMLARQKTTEGRFMYALPYKAPSGYETLQIKEERTTAVLIPVQN